MDIIRATDTLAGTVELSGHTKLVARRGSPDGEIVDIREQTNNILVGIRVPIISLLGAYGLVRSTYSINGAAAVPAGDSVNVGSVNGTVSYQVNYAASLPVVTSMAFGTSSVPATIFDTGIHTPIDINNPSTGKKNLAVSPTFSTDGLKATFAVMFADTEMNNVAVSEVALLTANNIAIARTVIGSYTKLPGMFFEFYWTIGYDPVSS